MWAALRALNNPPKTRNALEIVRQDGTISLDIKEILERWFNDISGLFSGLQDDPTMAYDDQFYEEVVQKRQEFEQLLATDQLAPEIYNSELLNSEISYDEVAHAIDKCKSRKAYLDIPNEALKNRNAKMLYIWI